jgi:hypothetical protein
MYLNRQLHYPSLFSAPAPDKVRRCKSEQEECGNTPLQGALLTTGAPNAEIVPRRNLLACREKQAYRKLVLAIPISARPASGTAGENRKTSSIGCVTRKL